jgi:outer membrane protein assembly factor BamB
MTDTLQHGGESSAGRRAWLGVLLVGTLIAAVALFFHLKASTDKTGAGGPARTPSPAAETPSAATVGVDYNGTASHLAAAPGFVFVSDWVGGRVLRVNSKGQLRGSLPVGLPQQGPLDLAYGRGLLFVLDYHDSQLWAVDPQTLLVRWKLAVPGEASSLSVAQGSVWVTVCCRQRHVELLRIDPTHRRVLKRTTLPGSDIARVRVGAEGIWVAIEARDDLYRLNPSTLSVSAKVHLGAPTTSTIDFELGGGSVWAVDSRSRVVQINPATGAIDKRSAPQAADPAALVLAVNVDSCYVSMDGYVVRFDKHTLRPMGRAWAGTVSDMMIVGPGLVWASSVQGLQRVTVTTVGPPAG